MKLPSPELLRLSKNLEDAPLTDVLGAAALSLEAAREVLDELFGSNALDRELIEVTMKPIIRELVKRRIDLENHNFFVRQFDVDGLGARGAKGSA